MQEENIYNIVKNIFKNKTSGETESPKIHKKIYKALIKCKGDPLQNIYCIAYDLKRGISTDKILSCLKDKKILWKDPSFNNYKQKIQEQDEFIENPFEVEEGVLECRCGSKRVFSYSKQTRSSDEPCTVFAQCMACKKQWTQN